MRARPLRLGRDKSCRRFFSNTSRASEDLPDPETPVTTVSRPRGKRASTLRRLCSTAPRISMAGVSRTIGRRRDLECRSGDARQRPGCRIAEECELCGSALGHQPAAAGARARTQIDDVIGAANRVFVVFDHHQGIALGAQPLEGIQKRDVVARVQADGGFVEHVAHALQIRSELRRQSNALRLAAGEAGRGAVQLQIAEPDVAEKARSGRRARPANRGRCRVRARPA